MRMSRRQLGHRIEHHRYVWHAAFRGTSAGPLLRHARRVEAYIGARLASRIFVPTPRCQSAEHLLFFQQLAEPLEALITARREALWAKNTGLFRHTGGYPLPEADDAEYLLGTGILLALHRQSEGKPCRAIGEKTPENVFFFPRLKQMFPGAKCIAIAREILGRLVGLLGPGSMITIRP